MFYRSILITRFFMVQLTPVHVMDASPFSHIGRGLWTKLVLTIQSYINDSLLEWFLGPFQIKSTQKNS